MKIQSSLIHHKWTGSLGLINYNGSRHEGSWGECTVKSSNNQIYRETLEN